MPALLSSMSSQDVSMAPHAADDDDDDDDHHQMRMDGSPHHHMDVGASADASVILSQLVAKVAHGASISKEELQTLRALHSPPNREAFLAIPPLTRASLNTLTTISTTISPTTTNTNTTTCTPTVVRHVGMVQDMLEPEYYVESYHGQSMHFRDWTTMGGVAEPEFSSSLSSSSSSSSMARHNLAERQPLLVTPVPFCSEWFAKRLHPPAPSDPSSLGHPPTAVVIPESPPATTATTTATTKSSRMITDDDEDDDERASRKRHHASTSTSEEEEEEECHLTSSSPTRSKAKVVSTHTPCMSTPTTTGMRCDGDGDPETPTFRTNPTTAVGTSPRLHGQESDWWPAGCCESPTADSPVLAKLYYDQYPTTSTSSSATADCGNGNGNDNSDTDRHKLRLNDMVEMIGVVSMDPWDADFGNPQDDEEADFLGLAIPPPSRLPRLHVLSFRRLDLDAMTHRSHVCDDPTGTSMDQEAAATAIAIATATSNDYDEQPSLTQEQVSSFTASNTNTNTNTTPLDAWTQECHSMKNATLSEALFLTLIAKAERQGGTLPPRAHDQALGCASLALECPDADASRRLYQRLLPFLKAICPVVAGFDATTLALSSGPTKETGRLEPNPWQLPCGATLLIHLGDRPLPSNTRQLLDELVGTHRLPYRFEGGMQVPFEADYRIILVSARTRAQPLPPCTFRLLTASTSTSNSTSSVEGLCLPRHSTRLHHLRRAVTEGRAQGNVHLSPQVLEQAQEDFLYRRTHVRNSNHSSTCTAATTTTTTTTTSQGLPVEADFHRWLTLTRLYARARKVRNATTVDWEAALTLDDAIRVQQP